MRRFCLVFLTLSAAAGVFASGSTGTSSTSSSSSTTAQEWYTTGHAAAQAGRYQDGVNAFQKSGSKNAAELLDALSDYANADAG
jgi:outer membrane protein assembly factor BamD (BamD/ComL family)